MPIIEMIERARDRDARDNCAALRPRKDGQPAKNTSKIGQQYT
jgi:hypothetical protein